MSNRELAISKVLNELHCNPIHRIALREILNVYEDDKMQIGTVYEKVSSKLRKDPTTIKSLLTRLINNIDSELTMNILGTSKKPKNKKFIQMLKEKVDKEKINEENNEK